MFVQCYAIQSFLIRNEIPTKWNKIMTDVGPTCSRTLVARNMVFRLLSTSEPSSAGRIHDIEGESVSSVIWRRALKLARAIQLCSMILLYAFSAIPKKDVMMTHTLVFYDKNLSMDGISRNQCKLSVCAGLCR